MENKINYWGLADEYATSKYKMEKVVIFPSMKDMKK